MLDKKQNKFFMNSKNNNLKKEEIWMNLHELKDKNYKNKKYKKISHPNMIQCHQISWAHWEIMTSKLLRTGSNTANESWNNFQQKVMNKYNPHNQWMNSFSMSLSQIFSKKLTKSHYNKQILHKIKGNL